MAVQADEEVLGRSPVQGAGVKLLKISHTSRKTLISMETCTMPRRIISARSVIIRRSAIRAWTTLSIAGLFISLRSASAGTRKTCVASSAMAVAMRGVPASAETSPNCSPGTALRVMR